MDIPFQLVRIDNSSTVADAFVIFASGCEPLGRACEILGTDSIPEIFRIAGGYLLVPVQPSRSVVPGALRLRRLAKSLFLPIDAVLSPTLLPDELAGLTRDRGLIVLRSGVYAFDPDHPVLVTDWLSAPQRSSAVWTAFPPPSDLAGSLRTIERPAPPSAVMEALQGGSPDESDPLPGHGQSGLIPESSRPPSAPMLTRLGAGAVLGVAQALAGIGRMLGSPGLANAGANLARRALESVPRLTERILGSQEAALREVLRQLQSGNIEQALRRAPIAVADPNQPSRVSSNADLGSRNPWYSLSELLGGGGSVASTWLGGQDVWAELQTEYRRLAEAAIRRGDYRRAAYLHGVLLRDLRTAANVLLAGGHFRDAGLIFREKLHDDLAAASAFESAGDYDEAVRLFTKMGHDLKAAELLRRIGDESRAIEFYLVAAEKLAAKKQYLEAGDLVQVQLGRSDLATDYFRAGWQADHTEAIGCAERFIDDHLKREDWQGFDALLSEACARLAPPRTADAGRLFNFILASRSQCLPPERAAELRDRTRLLFAEHLRQAGGSDNRSAQSTLFGQHAQNWSASVRRDVAYATRSPSRKPHRALSGVPVTQGRLRAVAYADQAGIVFLATSNTVIAWDAVTGLTRVVQVSASGGELIGISTDPTASRLYTLADRSTNLQLTLSTPVLVRVGEYQVLATTTIECSDPNCAYLPPRCFADTWVNIVVGVDGRRLGFHGHVLLPGSPGPFERTSDHVHLLTSHGNDHWDWADGEMIRRRQRAVLGKPVDWPIVGKRPIDWRPKRRWLAQPSLDWMGLDDRTFIVVGIDESGMLRFTDISFLPSTGCPVQHFVLPELNNITAVAICAERLVAFATKSNEIGWAKLIGSKLVRVGDVQRISTPGSVVFLAVIAQTNQLAAVTSDARVIRVPLPIL